MPAKNQLILISDEHARRIMGCYGDPVAHTPHLDALAARGTRFENCYTPCPICVPARASIATGRYGHETGHWDNASPYTGDPQGWAHRLQRAGVEVGSIGKLHYRSADDPVGFDFQENPMHVVNGIGDVFGCLRNPLPERVKARTMAEKIGPGETSYSAYDRDITQRAVHWLKDKAASNDTRPWVLFVSLVTPHFPLIAPQEFYDLYADKELMPSKPIPDDEHPWLAAMRGCILHDNFTDETTHIALTSYYGLVSFMDDCVGRILSTLDDAGLRETTQVAYTSDHGDNMGERGMWGKSNMYEESAGIPLILAGPDIPSGHVCTTPTNLIDLAPTILATAGIEPDPSLAGRSLVDIANTSDIPARVSFSEYHAMGSASGAFMIRKGRWKYVHYVGFAPQLFDLKDDPDELVDLGQDDAYRTIREELHAELIAICDPDAVDARAKADQMRVINRHGGAEAVRARGMFGATPPPGEKPEFV